jgi:hypothetical protein
MKASENRRFTGMAWGVLGFATMLFSSAVAEAARKAFVVGNAHYAHTTSLANPANDARDLAERLDRLGYGVTLVMDTTRAGFLEAFQRFVAGLARDDLALFYYAGHGLQIGGENYLFPVDARVEKEEDARRRLVPLNALLADLARSTKQRIVILDACRNNPFVEEIGAASATRSAGAALGLARVYDGVGSFIAYSTQPGNVALDGTGRNSPFTAALLRHLGAGNHEVHAVMRRVRAEVKQATEEQQIPWENSSLIEEVAFAGAGAVAGTAGGAGTSGGASVTGVGPAPRPAAERPRTGERQSGKRYSYVSGLDPDGDNFLALRTSPDASGRRIATMGPDTLLEVVESRGKWRRVVLRDGQTGWAHGNWIACCRMSAPSGGAGSLPAASDARRCDDLWRQRNAIWHRYGYCFKSAEGRRVFGNAGCSRDLAAARAAMSNEDRGKVDALAAREQQMSCN